MTQVITTLAQWNASPKQIGGPDSTQDRANDVWDKWSDEVDNHPMAARLEKNELPQEMEVLVEDEDDGETCYVMSFKYIDETYLVRFNWVSASLPFTLQKALMSSPEKFVKEIKDFLEADG